MKEMIAISHKKESCKGRRERERVTSAPTLKNLIA